MVLDDLFRFRLNMKVIMNKGWLERTDKRFSFHMDVLERHGV